MRGTWVGAAASFAAVCTRESLRSCPDWGMLEELG